MLKIEVENGHADVESNGTFKDLVIDLCAGIGRIYRILPPEIRNNFRQKLITMLVFSDSPVWNLFISDAGSGVCCVLPKKEDDHNA